MGKINVVNVFKKRQAPGDVEFHAKLKSMRENSRYFQFHCLDLSSLSNWTRWQKIKDEFVYFHLTDITHLSTLRDLLRAFKKNNCVLIVGGGVDIAINRTELLNEFNDLDVIIFSPAFDKVLGEFTGKGKEYLDLAKIKGIAFRSPGNEEEIVCTESPPIPGDIDDLSSVELFLHGAYDQEWYPIIVSLGCQFNCQYCGFQFLYSMNSNRAANIRRKKSAKTIVDEMEFLNSKGQKEFSFYCHQFLNKEDEFPNTINAIGEEIIKRKLDIRFHFSAKPSLLCRNKDTLKLLKKSGMVRVDIGIDSGLSRFHDMYQTGSTPQDCIDSLKYMHENKLDFDAFFVFYDPYLTIDELKENLDFIGEIKKYYSHLNLPISAHLDSRVFNSTLSLRYGMPIIDQLRKDNLLVEKPGFVSHPVAKFQDSQVIFIYSIYRALNEIILKKIRHFFYDIDVVHKYQFLETLLLNIMENLYLAVKENRHKEIKDYVYESEEWIKNAFKPFIGEIIANFPQYGNEELVNELFQKGDGIPNLLSACSGNG